MKSVIVFLMAFAYVYAFTQTTLAFPASTSVANTSASNIDEWTPFHNPAPLSTKTIPQLNILFENRYIITTLASKSFGFVWPANHFVTAFSVAHQGFNLYHEILLGLVVARNFSEHFQVGMQFNYHAVYFAPANRYYVTVYPQIGLIVPFDDDFRIGFHVFNPFSTHIKGETQTKYLPAVYSLGCAYDFSADFSWHFQVDREMSSYYRLAGGFDYQMLKRCHFKLGAYVHDFFVPCFGLGFKLAPLSFDLGVELHPLMGLNTLAQLQYHFNR